MAFCGIGPALCNCAEGQRLILWGRIRDGYLVDATGSVELVLGPTQVNPQAGSVGRVSGQLQSGKLVVDALHVRPTAGLERLGAVAGRVERIAARFALVERLRRALAARGYREVDTPLLLEAAGTDPFIDPMPARLTPTWNPTVPDRELSLHTSPELEMKRLIALGFPAIFQVAHVFRQGDWSDLHEPEFTMAEWYRVGFDAAQLAAETAAICTELADLPPASERTVADLCRELACVEVLDLQAGCQLSRALGGTEEPFIHAFSRLWVERVEPFLAQQGAVLVTRWPVALGMLARRAPDDPRVAERFELLVRGVELANGFAELTDPVEQRVRFQQDRAQRRSEGLRDAPTPERFLRALQAGLPPCAGVAVGVDRLAMIATDGTCLADMLASPLRDRLDCP